MTIEVLLIGLAALVALGILIYRTRGDQVTKPGDGDAVPARKDLVDAERVKLNGPGRFDFEIVGESKYQKNLAKIAGRKTEEGADHRCEATLILEDSNPHDPQAIRVDIDGLTVGYLSREWARIVRSNLSQKGFPKRDYVIDALIVGGWKRDGGEGHYGVKLDMEHG